MNFWYFSLGVLLLVATIVDQLWTTLWVDGSAGPLSARLTTLTWNGLKRITSSSSRLLSLSGPLVLVLTLGLWIGLLWAGWTLVFAGGEPALLDTRDQGVISWTERIYFVAYTLFTMGNGDFTPASGVWQLATALTTASGMLFVTLSVSYVLSVLGAISQKRSFATGVTGIGTRSEVFVETGWDNQNADFQNLELPLNTLATQLDTLVEQHRAYPILHYYHSEQGKHASAVAVAVLDEALLILQYGVPEKHRPNEAILNTARSSTQSYLQSLNAAFIHPADRTPPPPDLDHLRERNIPTVSDEEFAAKLDELEERRRKVLGMVQNDAWEWPPLDQ